MFICEFCKIFKNIFRQNTSGWLHLWILRSFPDHFFYRAPLGNCLFHAQVAGFQPQDTIHSWNTAPPSPLIKGGGRTFEKLSHLGEGGTKVFARKGGWVDVEMGGLPLFLLLYSSVQSHFHFRIFSLWVRHVRFSSTFSSKSCTKTWYHLSFLIHSGSLQKMLTALFWNTQKSIWTIFFECQGKGFLSIKKILEKIS